MPQEKQYKSAETVDDSASESDEDESENKNEASSSSDENSASPSPPAGAATTAKLKRNSPSLIESDSHKKLSRNSESAKSTQNSQNKSGSPESNRDDASNDSDTTGSDDSESEPAAKANGQHVTRPAAAPTSNGYKPPSGFERIQTGTGSQSQTTLTESNLSGKQLWHITAPASVPISEIKELASRHLNDGDAVIKHANIEYGFVKGSGKPSEAKVLVPDAGGNAYRPVGPGFTRVLHLQQIVQPIAHQKLQGGGNEMSSQMSEASTSSKSKPTRSQPKNLRMRYLPPGAASADPADDNWSSETSPGEGDDVEMADAEANEHQPPQTSTKSSKRSPQVEAGERLEKRLKLNNDAGALSNATAGEKGASAPKATADVSSDARSRDAQSSGSKSSDSESDESSEDDDDADSDDRSTPESQSDED